MIIGSYTDMWFVKGSASTGLSAAWLDTETGALVKDDTKAILQNPSWAAASADGTRIYVVEENDHGIPGRVLTLDTQTLETLAAVSSGGISPCHITVLPDGSILVANYDSGTVTRLMPDADGCAVLPGGQIRMPDPENGEGRQQQSHPHMTVHLPVHNRMLLADLGADTVTMFDGLSPIKEARLPKGTGPRHMAVSDDEKTVYVLGELSSTVCVLDLDPASGEMALRQAVSTLPDGYAEESFGAEIALSPDGKWLYASNRGLDSVAVFAVEAGGIRLCGQIPSGGTCPRSFAITKDGAWLLCANQDSDSILSYRLQPDGTAKEAGRLETPSPAQICLL